MSISTEKKSRVKKSRNLPACGKTMSFFKAIAGIGYCVGLITVRDDPDEKFFDYGYVKEKSKSLYCTVKNKIPSSFK